MWVAVQYLTADRPEKAWQPGRTGNPKVKASGGKNLSGGR
jgi:hypothetical protein